MNLGNPHIEPRRPINETASDLEALLRDGLHCQWNEYLKWRKKFLKTGSGKAVHRLRTSVRKLSSLLSSLEYLNSGKQCRELKALVERELKSLSTVRDAQIQQKELAKHPLGLLSQGKFVKMLQGKEAKGIRRAQKKFQNWTVRSQSSCLRKIDNGLTGFFEAASGRDREKALVLLQTSLDRDLEKLHLDEAGLKVGDEDSFHRLRLDIKNFDYKIEILDQAFAVPNSFKEKIKTYKMKLGRLQDRVELFHDAKGYFRKSSHHPHPKREFWHRIENQQRQFLMQ